MKILKSQLNAIDKAAKKIIDICGETKVLNIKTPKEVAEELDEMNEKEGEPDIDGILENQAEMEDKVHEEVVVEPQDPTEII